MIPLEHAVSHILDAVKPLAAETIRTCDASGRFTASDVRAALDLPPFDNSAMDGFAVRSADVAGASETSPSMLTLIGQAAAGSVFPGQIVDGTCVRVFTGSLLPEGADSVVMQEDTRAAEPESARVAVLCPVKPWESVRLRGEDVRMSSIILVKGQRLTPGRIALLQAAGLAQVEVSKRPRVAIVATGDELREPGAPLERGCIYESNRQMIAGLVAETGAEPQVFPLAPDRLEATQTTLREAFETCDAVITSGGASVGELDFVKPAFEGIGGSLRFWRVAMKPGKPFVFGERAGRLLFGLPGNPVSAFVTFHLLVRPALLRLQGAAACEPPTVHGTLRERLRNPSERRHFVRVVVDSAGEVRSAGSQASHLLHSLATANGLMDVPPGADLPAGAPVRVLLFGSLTAG